MKKPKTLDEHVEYLEEFKNVLYNDVNKQKAKEILLYNNYINVITPYKDNFHKGKDSNGNHIYDENTEFLQYKNLYINERRKYPKLIVSCLYVERTFNSVLSHFFLLSLGADYESKVDEFLKDDRFDFLLQEYSRYDNNIYLALDRLSFSKLIKLYKLLDDNVKSNVYKECRNILDGIVGSNPNQFSRKLRTVNEIRNVISHNNSLKIYTEFFYDKNLNRYKKRNPKGSQGKDNIRQTEHVLSNLVDKYIE